MNPSRYTNCITVPFRYKICISFFPYFYISIALVLVLERKPLQLHTMIKKNYRPNLLVLWRLKTDNRRKIEISMKLQKGMRLTIDATS